MITLNFPYIQSFYFFTISGMVNHTVYPPSEDGQAFDPASTTSGKLIMFANYLLTDQKLCTLQASCAAFHENEAMPDKTDRSVLPVYDSVGYP